MRDGIQTETAKLARTISQIESIFTNIKRGVQNIDAQKVVQVAGKLKAYSLEWTKLHDVRLMFLFFIMDSTADILPLFQEYTALVHESQLSANRVKSKIQCMFIFWTEIYPDHHLRPSGHNQRLRTGSSGITYPPFNLHKCCPSYCLNSCLADDVDV